MNLWKILQQGIYSEWNSCCGCDDLVLMTFTSLQRYLTVDYLLADTLQRTYTSDRESTIRRALEQYEKFLSRLDDYGLLNDNDKKLHERYISNPSSFSLTSTNDAATRREVKLSRFREEKGLKQRLEVCSVVLLRS